MTRHLTRRRIAPRLEPLEERYVLSFRGFGLGGLASSALTSAVQSVLDGHLLVGGIGAVNLSVETGISPQQGISLNTGMSMMPLSGSPVPSALAGAPGASLSIPGPLAPLSPSSAQPDRSPVVGATLAATGNPAIGAPTGWLTESDLGLPALVPAPAGSGVTPLGPEGANGVSEAAGPRGGGSAGANTLLAASPLTAVPQTAGMAGPADSEWRAVPAAVSPTGIPVTGPEATAQAGASSPLLPVLQGRATETGLIPVGAPLLVGPDWQVVTGGPDAAEAASNSLPDDLASQLAAVAPQGAGPQTEASAYDPALFERALREFLDQAGGLNELAASWLSSPWAWPALCVTLAAAAVGIELLQRRRARARDRMTRWLAEVPARRA